MLEDELGVPSLSRCIRDELRAIVLASTANVELLASADILDALSSLVLHSHE